MSYTAFPWTKCFPLENIEVCEYCGHENKYEHIRMAVVKCEECGASLVTCNICPKSIEGEPDDDWGCEVCPLL